MSLLRSIGICLGIGVLVGGAGETPSSATLGEPSVVVVSLGWADDPGGSVDPGDAGRVASGNPEPAPPNPSSASPGADTPPVAIEFEWVDSPRSGESIVVRATDDVLIARSHADRDAEPIAELPNPTQRGGPLVLTAVDPSVAEGAEWIEVRLPVRPNGTTGWVRATDVELFRNPYAIEVSTSEFEMTVLKHSEPVLVTEVALGREVAPTPVGEFFITELLQPASADGVYGPFAFGLSGFSDVYTSFAGGEGVIGIHGTNAPHLLGTAVSHGCVRVENDTIEALASLIPLGTPVTVSA